METKIFGREPALVIGVIGSFLTALAALELGFLSASQAGAATALITAIIIAATTEPKAPALFTGVFAAGVALFAEYGFDASDEVVASVTALIVAVCAFFGIRPQVAPKPTAVTRA